MKMISPTFVVVVVAVVMLLQQIHGSSGHQAYIDNNQMDCETNYSTTLGYVCNGAVSSCLSYLTFRSTAIYNSAATIGHLLTTDPSEITQIKNVSNVVDTFPTDTLLIVPINCSCDSTATYYQHNATYVLNANDTYFILANDTYQGLTTCQALIGLQLSRSTQRDESTSPFEMCLPHFQPNQRQCQLSSDSIIYPFTTILVPLKTKPTMINTSISPPPLPPSSPKLPAVPIVNKSNSSHKWVFIGAGVGGVFLLVAFLGFLFWFFYRRQYQHREPVSNTPPNDKKFIESSDYTMVLSGRKSWSVSSQGVQYVVGSLTKYKFEELQEATGFFCETNQIKGSVYRGSFKGDNATIKIMKGDVSDEINILKQINHSNIIRLSGFCVHDENTYLVYEHAENGSLSDWLHSNSKNQSYSTSLSWKQRVQIAYDVADALNYLHNYTSPPYIHKNLKSSNILLNIDLRAMIANFGLARSLPENENLQLTRHVVGSHGYMAPEYIENGLVTPKLDVYTFGVVMLELLSGREVASREHDGKKKKKGDDNEKELLSVTIHQALTSPNLKL
ncbi:Protein LYK5 [Camellia lanceoleosa]|uniref:Protein LYK5 n=1 Tax=Camellia lanceoleosa TaxID=1840588 RepID=A0ACC0G7U5_9ERIC|nr:Protein LYK5 [Camellia lanceoleosa]